MPADDTNGPGGRTSLTGFLTNADDTLRTGHDGDRPPAPQPARFVGRVPLTENPWSDDDVDDEWPEADEAFAPGAAERAEGTYEVAPYEPEVEDVEEVEDDWRQWGEPADRSPGLLGLAAAGLILLIGGGGVAAIGWNLTHSKHDVLPVAAAPTEPQPVEIASASPPAAAPAASRAVAPIPPSVVLPERKPAVAAHAARHAPPEKAHTDKRALAKAKTPPKEAVKTAHKDTAKTTKLAAAKAPAKATAKPSPKVLAKAATPARGKSRVDCSNPQTVSRHMACDPALTAANERVDRAYLSAVAAGVPEAQMRTQHSEWLNVRDEAAKRSPAALADAYKARTSELERQRDQALAEPPH